MTYVLLFSQEHSHEYAKMNETPNEINKFIFKETKKRKETSARNDKPTGKQT